MAEASPLFIRLLLLLFCTSCRQEEENYVRKRRI